METKKLILNLDIIHTNSCACIFAFNLLESKATMHSKNCVCVGGGGGGGGDEANQWT
jgi:hypothetical protein